MKMGMMGLIYEVLYTKLNQKDCQALGSVIYITIQGIFVKCPHAANNCF